MSDFKDWYCDHQDGCDYCQRVNESIVLSENRKMELMDKHTMDAFGHYADMVHDMYEERELV